MLLYVFSRNELGSLLERLGYECDDGLFDRMIDYYEPRTAHGSTLSRVVHAWNQAQRDRERSWHLFVEALYSDLNDAQGGTTKEGIHLGAMAGTIDLVQRCYTGLEIVGGVLRFDPTIPTELGSVSFDIRYQSHVLHLEFSTSRARIRMDEDEGATVAVAIGAETYRLGPDEMIDVTLDRAGAPSRGNAEA